MNLRLNIRLQTSETQNQRLQALQRAFAELCNALAPMARDSGVWSRVGLHHLGYRAMRERFPELGSQMVCNAVYSVSRACRLVYQHPNSPFNVQRVGAKSLPLVQFGANAPVYFDRHTLSIRSGRASMFTLDGRMHFNLPLAPADEERLRNARLIEIVLSADAQGYVLGFVLGTAEDGAASDTKPGKRIFPPADEPAAGPLMPEYLVLLDEAAEAAQRPPFEPVASPKAAATDEAPSSARTSQPTFADSRPPSMGPSP